MRKIVCYLSLSLLSPLLFASQPQPAPFQVNPALFKHSQPETLGLAFAKGTETFTVYKAQNNGDKYTNGAVLIGFKGKLYAQWQSSSQDEDAEDTWLAYSYSKNGETWSKPMVLADKWDDGIRTSGGWWTDGETLVAYINVWPKNLTPKGGHTEYRSSTDGVHWSKAKPVLDNNGKAVKGVFEQDPHKLDNGLIVNAMHRQPGVIVTPIYTEDPLGIAGWTTGKMENLPYKSADISRELEPSLFVQNNGTLTMIFRDQASSFKILASVSEDKGKTWSTPTLSNMPDSRSKKSAGNLPDGTAYIINNPTTDKTRIPLVITLSKDGKYFDKAFLLRAGGKDLQPLRYEGKYKRAGYSYPKATLWKDYLYVSYASNKEDVEITRVPVKNLSH
ncbi:BNR repeat-like domain-containing protein [Alteromonadaceae bacterium Bs31]|nr:BNR repeat-like domain-containing protein [Alteromonadaceae bacterium Bs31]